MKTPILIFILLFSCVSLFSDKTEKSVDFEIYSETIKGETHIFLRVTNNESRVYEMEEPHSGIGRDFYRCYKIDDKSKYGNEIDPIAVGTRLKGPTIKVEKGKPYIFRLYILPKDLNKMVKIVYCKSSGEEIFCEFDLRIKEK